MSLRFLTSGESHGPALLAILDGLPAGLALNEEVINAELRRRQQGTGAGPRMKLEHDTVQILGGVMAGKTTGAPLARAQREKSQVSLLFIDLDRFKHINDSQGHDVGDQVLGIVARRLDEQLRADDFVARLGGDEFAVILNHPPASRAASRVARKLNQALTEPFKLAQRRYAIGASIGISVYPDDGLDANTLLRQADLAMYQAKQRRSGFEYFSDDLNTIAQQQLTLETGLRQALGREELEHDGVEVGLRLGVARLEGQGHLQIDPGLLILGLFFVGDSPLAVSLSQRGDSIRIVRDGVVDRGEGLNRCRPVAGSERLLPGQEGAGCLLPAACLGVIRRQGHGLIKLAEGIGCLPAPDQGLAVGQVGSGGPTLHLVTTRIDTVHDLDDLKGALPVGLGQGRL